MMSRDSRAIQGGLGTPAHLGYRAQLVEFSTYATQLEELAGIIDYVMKYSQRRHRMAGKTIAKKDGPIFIGHGRSKDWMELKDFIVNRLKLEHEEFNRRPVAGRTTKDRLEEMLDKCCFAFLVMTAEDEQSDGKKHARQNVIHEVGLFQGRYGFERAIVLLEEGCEEFSNIVGVGQIRFPSGRIKAAFEEVREILEHAHIA